MKKHLQMQVLFWQREKDSNPHIQSQSLLCYPYTIPLYSVSSDDLYYYIHFCVLVNSFAQKYFVSAPPFLKEKQSSHPGCPAWKKNEACASSSDDLSAQYLRIRPTTLPKIVASLPSIGS